MENMSFEAGMLELEQLARALEAGEMTLEESFSAYERACALKKALEAMLNAGDQRIRLLMDNGETELDAEELQ